MHKTILHQAKFLVLFLSLLFLGQEAKATHLVGGSLNYEYLGENPDGTYRYRIFSVTYTDVGPDSQVQTPEGSLAVGIYTEDPNAPDADKNLEQSVIVPLIQFELIELEGVPDGCTVGQNVQIAKAEYELFVNLPANLGGYWLYYDRCCRNDAVVNLQDGMGVGFTTYMPPAFVENSSPFFNVDPVPFLCVGDTSTFLNSAIDPDGDQMIFSFISPARGYGNTVDPVPAPPAVLGWEIPNVQYNVGFSPEQPFGSDGYAFINASTGLTSYMATNPGQYSIAVEIREYRNGNLIGITRRDLQLVVIDCPPNPSPDLSNVSAGNVGPTSWEIHEGDTLCFPVVFEDGNGDSLFLSSFGEIFDNQLINPVAEINTPIDGEATVQADFCWYTDCDLGRENSYFFGITATDNGCPPKSASEIYSIEVIPFLGSTQMQGEANVCVGATETYTTDVFDEGSYTWTASGGTILSGQGSSEIEVEWNNPGIQTISVTATNFRGCVGDPFDMEVSVTALPVVDAGNDTAICLGDTISIGGSPTGPVGSFYLWEDMDGIDELNVANPDVFPTEDSEFVVQVIAGGSCTARDTVRITVNEAVLNIGDDQDICLGDSVQISASGAQTYTWTPAIGLSNPSIANPMASPASTTTYTLNSVDANLCETSAELTVNVFEIPNAQAGPDSTVCGQSIQLQASPSVGIGAWSSVNNVSFSDDSSPTSFANVTQELSAELVWTESTGNGLCISRDTVEIQFLAQPEADAGPNADICGLGHELQAILTTGHNGEWIPQAGITFTDASSPISQVSADDYGSYQLSWIETNAQCRDTATVDLQFIEIPQANAGNDDEICGSAYTLAAQVDLGTGTWSGSGNVSFSDPGDPNAEVNSTAFGVETLTWTEDNQGCTAQASVDIEFVEIPNPEAGPDDTACGLGYSLQALASIGTGTWTVPPGLGIADVNSPTSSVSATSFGEQTLTWTEENGICSASDEVIITFAEIPSASAGADDAICGNEYTLQAQASIGTGTWTGPAGVSFADANSPSSEVSSSNFGVQILTWTEDNQGCTDESTVEINFIEIPIAQAGNDTVACGLVFELGASISVGTGTWSTTGTASIDTPNSPNSETTAPGFGPQVFTWTEDNQGCISSDEITVDFTESPIADAGADDNICGDSYTLAASPSLGNGQWSGSGNVSFADPSDPATQVSISDYGVETMTWTEDNNGCVATAEVDIEFFEIPVANAGEDIALCGTEISLAAQPSIGQGNWTAPSEISLSDPQSPTASSSSTSFGTFILTWTEDSNGCTDSDEVELSYLEVPVADAGDDENLCIGSSLMLNGQGGTSFAWTPIDALDNPNSSTPEANPEVDTEYILTVGLVNGCTHSDTMLVDVLDLPEVSAGEDVDYLCYGDSVQLQSTPGLSTYNWSPSSFLSATDLATPYAGPISNSTSVFEMEYVLTAADSDGCENSDTVMVVFYPDVITDAGADTIICGGNPVTLGGIDSPEGTSYLWSPTEGLSDSTVLHPVVSPTQTTTYFLNTSNSVCTGVDAVVVEVENDGDVSFEMETIAGCQGLLVKFDNSGDPSLIYHWDFGNGAESSEASPSHLFGYGFDYNIVLSGTSSLGCTYTLEQPLEAGDFSSYFDLIFPNVFTPNGDGENDLFSLNVSGQIEDCFRLEIFNRWGQSVFLSSGNNTVWDGYTPSGELLQPGVYFYVADFNGQTYKGSVQVIR